jgi:glycosyltransferase involved in cell wall biosynthesis
MAAGRRVRVLHFVDLPVPNPWLNGVATHHDSTRYEHLVASLGPRTELHTELEKRRMRTFALDTRSRRDFPRSIGRLAAILRRERVDILQTHLFWPSQLGLLAGAAARTPVKLVTRHHSDFTTTFDRPLHRRLDSMQARWADRVLAASDAVKRDMMRYESVPEDKIVVARYGYDFDNLCPMMTADERASMRDEFGGSGRVLVETVARLSPSKGHEFYFKALSRLVPEHPELLAIMAGTGPLRDDLIALATSLGIGEIVRFLGWRGDAHRVIEAADFIVHPSLHEAFCSVIIESMALERPIVSTDIAAAREQIDDGETGILVAARDEAAIERAIRWILSNPTNAAAMGKLARQRVNERFNFPRMMHWYEEIYATELRRAGRPVASAA